MLETAYIILEKAIQFNHDSYYMLNTTRQEEFLVVNRNSFLARTRVLNWIMCVLELSKLFGNKKTEDFSLIKILNKMKHDFKNAEWNNKISIKELDEMMSSLGSNDIQEKIQNLKKMRDEHYVHKDKKPTKELDQIKLYYPDIEYLINVAGSIIQSLHVKIIETDIILKPYDQTSLKSVINQLVEYSLIKSINKAPSKTQNS